VTAADRIEAGAAEFAAYTPGDDLDEDARLINAGCRYSAKRIIEAADSVMFSEEAIERAGRAEHANDWHRVNLSAPDWEDEDANVRDGYRQGVRVIIAALKGAGE